MEGRLCMVVAVCVDGMRSKVFVSDSNGKICLLPPCTYSMSELGREGRMVALKFETKLRWPKVSPQGREAARAMLLDPRPPS